MNDFDIIEMVDSIDDMSVLQDLEDLLPDDMAYLATDKLNKKPISNGHK